MTRSTKALTLLMAVVPLAAIGPRSSTVERNGVRAESNEQTSLEVGPLHMRESAESLACKINIRAKNLGSRDIDIRWNRSRVRTRVGTWKGMAPLGTQRRETVRHAKGMAGAALSGTGSIRTSRTVSLACNARRRYRFTLEMGGVEQYYYYPSSSGFTQKTTIDLGDLNRFFR